MAEQNIHINYSAADIQRYLQGSMSAKEMHEMERAALQDPFLADAIEGFNEASFEQSNKHLNEITALLQANKEDAKVVVMPTKSFQWWRVAAMVILIAGAGTSGWYIFSLNSNADHKNIAQVNVAKEQKADTIVEPATVDTSTLIAGTITVKTKKDNTGLANNNLGKEKIVASSKASNRLAAAPVLHNTDKNAEPVIKKDEDTETQPVIAFAPAASDQKPLANTALRFSQDSAVSHHDNFTVNEFKGRVTDNNKQPLANAVISAGNHQATLTDADGYFTLKGPDSLLNVTVSSIGFASTHTALKINAYNNIAVLPDNQSLSEVVVTGYATKKKTKNKSVDADSAFPAGGWQSFQDYVYKKLHKKLDSTNNGGTVNGDVEVEFLVHDDGTPYNFNVTKSLGQAPDSQAIDLIKNGPRWISARKNKKAKVTIPF